MARRMARRGRRLTAWNQRFAEAVRYCKMNRKPGERFQDCISRVLKGGKKSRKK